MKPVDERALEVIAGRLLRERGLTVAAADSCTGGLVGHRLTDVPGSSAYYLGSVTAYASEAKVTILGVTPATLEAHGAVSEETALEMAQGVQKAFGSDIGLAVTGVAGPDGGSEEKPVGLVYVALAAENGVRAERCLWDGDRWENKARSSEAVLNLLVRYLRET